VKPERTRLEAPDGRCDRDTAPARGIWGANGRPRVITVGAVNKNEQFVGYFTSDSRTPAATPIAAGLVALLKQAKPAATQGQVKHALRSTTKDIGPAGFDQHSGAGIIRAEGRLRRARSPGGVAGESGRLLDQGGRRLLLGARRLNIPLKGCRPSDAVRDLAPLGAGRRPQGPRGELGQPAD
jgi:serine protease AprX